VHIIWHLTSAVFMLAFVGSGIAVFYIAYHSILFGRARSSAYTAAPLSWQQSVEIPETARPHVRKMRNGIMAFLACFTIAAAANLITFLVGY